LNLLVFRVKDDGETRRYGEWRHREGVIRVTNLKIKEFENLKMTGYFKSPYSQIFYF